MQIVKEGLTYINDEALKALHHDFNELVEEVEDLYDLAQPCNKTASMQYLSVLDKISEIRKEIKEGEAKYE